MKTLFELETRVTEIRAHMDRIFTEMSGGFEGRESRAVELMAELTGLVKEAKVLDHNLGNFRGMMHVLMTSRCSGPH
jgi:hypothetical protein